LGEEKEIVVEAAWAIANTASGGTNDQTVHLAMAS